ncbi:DUF2634 domain-containing protein [Cohnella panacarvi]|uniref:DUF2634 domain-containing protein n=1 Tax=Cohnella panacarvi TaxID=400776 RepID=UPI00047AEAD6|nr:DUF2634 domain-containing protein [Cohnella panacarvi]
MSLPVGAALAAEWNVQPMPSRTYRIDWARGRVIGMVDDLEAVRQQVYKILRTERFRHVIYSGNIGHSIRVGFGYQAELQTLVAEALLVDDRVKEVIDFRTSVSGDAIEVGFTVVTIYGATMIRGVI